MSPTEIISRQKKQIKELNQQKKDLHEQKKDLHEQKEYFVQQVEEFANLIQKRDKTITSLQNQITDLIKRIYGRSSEKLDPNQLLMEGMILEDEAVKSSKKEESGQVIEREVRSHTRRHRGRVAIPEHLERVDHYLDIDEEDKICKICHKEAKKIGEEKTERIDYRRSTLFVNRYIRPKYACSDSGCDGCGIQQHEPPAGPIDRCEAESGLLAHIIEEKYEHHMPLYRQELRFERQGVPVSRKTMSGWLGRTAEVLLPLYNLKKGKILSHDIVLNDDTPVEMQEKGLGRTHTARLWCTVGGKDLQYTLYEFTLGRGRDGPLNFFSDYTGYFMSDAYGGYEELFKREEIKSVGCWAHARRYFVKAQETSPKAATEILTFIAQLYRIEKQIKHASLEERRHVRQKKSRQILQQIRNWLEKNLEKHLPQSPLRKGMEYTLRIWDRLCVYTEDPRLPIDNNMAEQGIRPIALGRKNWLFVGSQNGGRTAAVLMTFCTTCRRLKINTWEYLKDVLQRINTHPMSRLHELLPDEWQKLRNK